jgi:predicted GNAT family N-acyltransferase
VFDDLIFKVANERERVLALALRQSVLEDEQRPDGFDRLDEISQHLIASNQRGEVVAALRWLGEEHRPYDFERYLDPETFLGPHRGLAFIGRLCVRKDYRLVRRAAFLQMGMLKLTYDFAVKREVSDIFMYTFAHLLRFYRGIFFIPLEISFVHPLWGPVHLMHLNITSLPDRCSGTRSSLARLLFTGEHPNFVV